MNQTLPVLLLVHLELAAGWLRGRAEQGNEG